MYKDIQLGLDALEVVGEGYARCRKIHYTRRWVLGEGRILCSMWEDTMCGKGTMLGVGEG